MNQLLCQGSGVLSICTVLTDIQPVVSLPEPLLFFEGNDVYITLRVKFGGILHIVPGLDSLTSQQVCQQRFARSIGPEQAPVLPLADLKIFNSQHLVSTDATLGIANRD